MTDPIRTPGEALEAAAQEAEAGRLPLIAGECAAAIRALALRIAAPGDEALVEELPFRIGQAATNADEMSWQPLRPSSPPSVKRGRCAMSNDPAANMASLAALRDDLCETESATVDRRQLCEWLSAMQAQAHEIGRLQAELAMSKADERWQAVADEVGQKLLALEAERDDPRLELVDRALLDRVRDLIGLSDLAASAHRARATLDGQP